MTFAIRMISTADRVISFLLHVIHVVHVYLNHDFNMVNLIKGPAKMHFL